MNSKFVNKTFGDGDKDIYLPPWAKVLQKENVNNTQMNLEKEQQKQQFIAEDEIALKHPQSGAIVKVRDDGAIELYVNEDTGMRFDPEDNSITLYGDSIHFASKEMRMHTKPYGFIWNNHNLNPYLYYGDKVDDNRYIPQVSLNTAPETGRTSTIAPIFQEQTRKHYYDDKVQSLIDELGIESARMKRGTTS